jgi:hypothetical protein
MSSYLEGVGIFQQPGVKDGQRKGQDLPQPF